MPKLTDEQKRELRQELRALYGTTDKIRILTQDAGIDDTRINWNKSVVDSLHAVVEEADKLDRMLELVKQGLVDYPDRPVLLTIRNLLAPPPPPSPPPTPPPPPPVTSLVQIPDDEEYSQFIWSGFVLVLFSLPGDERLKTLVSKVAEAHSGRLKVGQVRYTRENAALIQQLNIRDLPALFLYVNGICRKVMGGATGKEQLDDAVR